MRQWHYIPAPGPYPGEPTGWTNIHSVSPVGGKVTYTGVAADTWAGVCTSVDTKSGDCSVAFKVDSLDTVQMVGLSATAPPGSPPEYSGGDFVVFLNAGSGVLVFENGSSSYSDAIPYTVDDVFSAVIEGGVYKAKKNGVVFFISGATPAPTVSVYVVMSGYGGITGQSVTNITFL